MQNYYFGGLQADLLGGLGERYPPRIIKFFDLNSYWPLPMVSWDQRPRGTHRPAPVIPVRAHLPMHPRSMVFWDQRPREHLLLEQCQQHHRLWTCRELLGNAASIVAIPTTSTHVLEQCNGKCHQRCLALFVAQAQSPLHRRGVEWVRL